MYESRYDIEDTISELRKQVDESQRELVKTTKELNKLEMDVQSTNVESEELQVSHPHRQPEFHQRKGLQTSNREQ